MIKKLKLENFKCFTGQEIDFKRLTILVGENASGKSSIIQSILLAQQISKYSNNVTIRPSEFYNIPLNTEKFLELGTVNEIYNGFNDKEEIKISIITNTNLGPFEDDDDEKNFFKYEILSKVDLSAKNTFLQIKDDETVKFSSFDNIYYIASERVGPRKYQEISSDYKKLCGYKGEYTFDVINKNLQTKIDENRIFNNENEDRIDLFRINLEQWLDFIIPGVSLNTEGLEDFNLVSLKLKKKGFRTDFLSPTNIGFGISYILPIITTILLADEEDIIIIENPEVHLHPASQSKMGKFIARMAEIGPQIIVETHSEHILNGIRLSVLKGEISKNKININYLKATSEEKSNFIDIEELFIDEYGELSKIPEGFFDQEENDLKEMIKLKIARIKGEFNEC